MASPDADTIGRPVQRVAAGETEIPANQIDETTAVAGLMVEPHARLGAADHDREAALAAPAPFLARPKGRLAQKLHRQLRHARAAPHRSPANPARSSPPPRNGLMHA